MCPSPGAMIGHPRCARALPSCARPLSRERDGGRSLTGRLAYTSQRSTDNCRTTSNDLQRREANQLIAISLRMMQAAAPAGGPLTSSTAAAPAPPPLPAQDSPRQQQQHPSSSSSSAPSLPERPSDMSALVSTSGEHVDQP